MIISLLYGIKEINFNLKLTFMKTNFIYVVGIILAFSFGGCTTPKNFDFKVSVVPQAYNSVTTLGDLNKAAEVINKRLEYFFNIPQERIKLDVTENKILLTMSKIDTSKINLIKKVITGYDKLEFWETYENSEITGYLSKANNMLRDMQTGSAGAGLDKTDIHKVPAGTIKKEKQNPLFGILSPRVTAQGEPLPSCMIGLVSGKDTSEINRYLKMDQIKALFPGDLKFYWSANPYKYDRSKSLYELHAIKVTTSNKQAPLDGSVIISAKAATGSDNSGVKIDLKMDSEGAKTWAGITRENINRCIAVVYNGYVRSYPRVISEISGGSTEITGDFTIEEANDLVNILKSGELPFELKIVEAQIIRE
jgi:SecD/SecF fusion protein